MGKRKPQSWLKRSAAAWASAIATTCGIGQGYYNATDAARKILKGLVPSRVTANEGISSTIGSIRPLCRSLERNNSTARAAVEGLTANIVGTGIALEPDCGDERINALIRFEWKKWCEHADVTGALDFEGLQSQACREWGTVGEALWRVVVLPERLKKGWLPIAILPLESEWLLDQPISGTPNAVTHVSGIDLDKFGRPVNYYLRNPDSTVLQDVEVVSADQMVHIFERRRSLQARGEPPMAPIIETLYQEKDLVTAELESAKNTAAMAMVITSDAQQTLDTDQDGDPVQNIPLGGVTRLFPGETAQAFSHDRPNQAISPFRQMLRGDIAAALRIGQRWLDRDVSRANYSSMRCDMLDNERLMNPVRQWFGRAACGSVYEAVLPWIALKLGIKTPPSGYRLVPEGQPYVDPQKDIQGAILGIASGLSTWEIEIGKRGGDAKELVAQLEKELTNPLLQSIFAAQLKQQNPQQQDPNAQPAVVDGNTNQGNA